MPFKARLTTKGFEEYLERIAASGKNVDTVADDALQAGAEVILEGMRRRVPVDTGNLRDTLAIYGPIEDGNYHYVDIGILREGHNKADAETARYAFAQEFGWGPDHPAQPYIRPTMDEDSRQARKVMKQKFKQALGMETE